jgi:hypothetical protein
LVAFGSRAELLKTAGIPVAFGASAGTGAARPRTRQDPRVGGLAPLARHDVNIYRTCEAIRPPERADGSLLRRADRRSWRWRSGPDRVQLWARHAADGRRCSPRLAWLRIRSWSTCPPGCGAGNATRGGAPSCRPSGARREERCRCGGFRREAGEAPVRTGAICDQRVQRTAGPLAFL